MLKILKTKGGFFGEEKVMEKTHHINTWVTAFTTQSLSILINKNQKKY